MEKYDWNSTKKMETHLQPAWESADLRKQYDKGLLVLRATFILFLLSTTSKTGYFSWGSCSAYLILEDMSNSVLARGSEFKNIREHKNLGWV